MPKVHGFSTVDIAPGPTGARPRCPSAPCGVTHRRGNIQHPMPPMARVPVFPSGYMRGTRFPIPIFFVNRELTWRAARGVLAPVLRASPPAEGSCRGERLFRLCAAARRGRTLLCLRDYSLASESVMPRSPAKRAGGARCA